jgi:hypothetical protein
VVTARSSTGITIGAGEGREEVTVVAGKEQEVWRAAEVEQEGDGTTTEEDEAADEEGKVEAQRRATTSTTSSPTSTKSWG